MMARYALMFGCIGWVTLCVSLVSGCAHSRPASSPPGWWHNMREHDARHLYFKAKGESLHTIEDARQMALASVRRQVSDYILTDLKMSRDHAESGFALREVETYAEHEGRAGNRKTVWMLGRYPRPQYDRIRNRLETGQRLEDLWRQAQSAVNRDMRAEAETLLTNIVGQYDKGLRMSFPIEAVKLELAGLYVKMELGAKANAWIEDVRRGTTDAAWRARAEELRRQLPPPSVRAAFADKTVGILALKGTDGAWEADANLLGALGQSLARHSVKTVAMDRPVEMGLPGFDTVALRKLAAAFSSRQADVALVVALEIDSSKTGKRVPIPGAGETMQAYDARMAYYVVRVPDGGLLASDSTVGYAQATGRLLHTILTHRRHLPQHAWAIAGGLDGAGGNIE